MADFSNNYKVRLVSVASLIDGISTGDIEQVIFEVTPSFTESRSVEYSPITPVHMPGSIQVYKNTNSRQFSIGAHFISRTSDEATQNMIYVQTLRAWMLPYFGSTSTLNTNANRPQAKTNQRNANIATNQPTERPLTPEERARLAQNRVAASGIELRGAPPDVLYLYAYSTPSNEQVDQSAERSVAFGVNINRVPVVISNLEITYPEDVDYIPTYANSGNNVYDKTSEPFPMRMDVSITLLETHSPREYEKFDLTKFKFGVLPNF